jgi:D-aminoacyl-tRNA deacylase
MRVVIQRSLDSYVEVDNKSVGKIQHGMVLLVCFEKNDSEEVIKKAGDKILALRIFKDPSSGKMSHSLFQSKGQILCISQFTLSWDGSRGNRPGFDNSMEPEKAQQYFSLFCQYLAQSIPVESGVFGADMAVHIKNDGPVTFFLEF